MKMPDMKTDRLYIRSTTESDGPNCLEIWLDDEMGKYLADPPRDKADEAELNFAVGIENDEGWYPMVVFKKQSGDFIGTCSVVPEDGGSRWDLGYCIHKKFQRQGYATEMLLCLINAGRNRGVTSFTAKVAKDNPGSNALMRKLGFRILRDDGSFRKRGTDLVYEEYTYILK